ncbi:MAG: MarC family protein [Chitinophagaceae bacterium]|nr:MarC family protein [Chitinophagaceae bacterium]
MIGVENISLAEIITTSLTLFAVIDMLGSVPVLLSLKKKMGDISSVQATLVSALLMFGFFFVGDKFLNLMGLDISSFAIAGSIVIFVLGLEMVLGMEFFKGEQDAKSGSIVPIAFPLIAGSGTLTTIMSLKATYHAYNILIAIFINLIVIFIILRSLSLVERLLGPSGITVVRKFFGVILLAIAIKIFKNNLGVDF